MSTSLSISKNPHIISPTINFDPIPRQEKASGRLKSMRADLIRDTEVFDDLNCLITDSLLEIINGYLGPDQVQEKEAVFRQEEEEDLATFLVFPEKVFNNQVCPFQCMNAAQIKDALIHALDRIQKDYPEVYKEYVEKVKLTHDLSSADKSLLYFIQEISLGYCAGTANALFDNIVRQNSSSLKESAFRVQNEDVCYGQILHMFKTMTNNQYKDINQAALLKVMSTSTHVQQVLEKSSDFLELVKNSPSLRGNPSEDDYEKVGNIFKKIFSEEIETIKPQLKEKLRRQNAHLDRNFHTGTFLDSEKFFIKSSAVNYQRILETAMRCFPKSLNFVGVIHLPAHVLSFQYGPLGHFLCDTYNSAKGLFAYPNRKTFFQQLRYHALYDARCSHIDGIVKEKPRASLTEITTKSLELLEKETPYFSVRPLEDINPNHTFSFQAPSSRTQV